MSARKKGDLGFDDESMKRLVEAYKPVSKPAPDNLFSVESLRMLSEHWLSDTSVKNPREALSSSDSEFSAVTLSAFDLSALQQLSETLEESTPRPDPNLTSKDVAAWMLWQVERNGTLYQRLAASHISRSFGKNFIYLNENSNPAISREVLKEFLAISLETVVWSRPKRYWRRRRVGDKPKQRMVDE